MTQIEKNIKRFTEAINTIEELMPSIRGYLAAVADKNKGRILMKPLISFLSDKCISTRLMNVFIAAMKNGVVTDSMTVSDFIREYPKMRFAKWRNCGKQTVRELELVFRESLVEWK